MSRFKAALIIFAAVAVALASAASALTSPEPSAGRGVVMFIGDSNITLGAGSITYRSTFSAHRDTAYTPVFEARPGAGLRTSNCAFVGVSTCTAASDYWEKRLPSTLSRVSPAAIVVNLGVNDTTEAGTATTRGYSYYGKKIDEFMKLLPTGVPVFWTNLPCAQIVSGSPSRDEGCKRVNYAIGLAPSRWGNLTVINWSSALNLLSVASPNTKYFADSLHIHYSPTGYTKWTDAVLAVLDQKVLER